MNSLIQFKSKSNVNANHIFKHFIPVYLVT